MTTTSRVIFQILGAACKKLSAGKIPAVTGTAETTNCKNDDRFRCYLLLMLNELGSIGSLKTNCVKLIVQSARNVPLGVSIANWIL